MAPLPPLRSAGQLSPSTAYALSYDDTPDDGSGFVQLDRKLDQPFDPALAHSTTVVRTLPVQNMYSEPVTTDDGKDERGLSPGSQRTLKQTKRAAQNRAAQRAFRERKDKFVKDLQNRAELAETLALKERQISEKQASLDRREEELRERCRMLDVQLSPGPLLGATDDEARADHSHLPRDALQRLIAEKKDKLCMLQTAADTLSMNISALEKELAERPHK